MLYVIFVTCSDGYCRAIKVEFVWILFSFISLIVFCLMDFTGVLICAHVAVTTGSTRVHG